MTNSKTPQLLPKKSLTKTQTKEMASRIVAKLDLMDLAQKVAEEMSVTEDEALAYVRESRMDREVARLLVESIQEGAMASKAMLKLQEAIGRGEEWAVRLGLAFNPTLVPASAKQIQNLHLHDEKTVNIFQDLDKRAKKLLGEREPQE